MMDGTPQGQRVSACAACLGGGGLNELGDGCDVLLRVGDVRQVSIPRKSLAGGVWEDGGELVEHRCEERRALGAAGEQYRTLEAGESLRVDLEGFGVAGLVERSEEH